VVNNVEDTRPELANGFLVEDGEVGGAVNDVPVEVRGGSSVGHDIDNEPQVVNGEGGEGAAVGWSVNDPGSPPAEVGRAVVVSNESAGDELKERRGERTVSPA
jgi:hypothetical protein